MGKGVIGEPQFLLKHRYLEHILSFFLFYTVILKHSGTPEEQILNSNLTYLNSWNNIYANCQKFFKLQKGVKAATNIK